MIDRHTIFPSTVQYTHGRSTYVDDFHKIITPVLEDTFKIGEVSPDVVWSPIRIPSEYMDKYPDAHFLINLHDDAGVIHSIRDGVKCTFITHYKRILAEYKDKIDVRFIPMSIDTEVLPDVVPKTQDSMIYFGNVYKNKKDKYEELKREYKFDTLSYSYYNDGKVRLSQKECWDIVSKYEYGMGVGRSAIEMLCMGLKVRVGGRKYGGKVTATNFQEHWDGDFDSEYFNEEGEYITVLRSIFDMRNYVEDYVNIIKSIKI
jgi:hypothetical protein